MKRRISQATTRTAVSRHEALVARLLAPAQVVVSPETKVAYRIDKTIGKGGFGQVYLARRVGRSASVPGTVCIKISPYIDGWVREAYFGRLLDSHPRAIRTFDAFPLLHDGGRILYCLALELAEHGDLSAYLRSSPKGWSEAAARRESAGILEVLGTRHKG